MDRSKPPLKSGDRFQTPMIDSAAPVFADNAIVAGGGMSGAFELIFTHMRPLFRAQESEVFDLPSVPGGQSAKPTGYEYEMIGNVMARVILTPESAANIACTIISHIQTNGLVDPSELRRILSEKSLRIGD